MESIIRNLTLVGLSLIIFFGCDKTSVNDDDSLHGSGRIVSEIRSVEECSGLTIQNIGNIYLTQDDNQSIRIEADDNIMNKVITRKENNKLLIGLDEGSYSNVTLKAYVSLKTIRSILINGAGSLTSENSLSCDTLDLTVNGAGNVSIQGDGNYLNCLINGAGNVTANNFVVEKCKAFVNGAGNLTINVTETLDATVNGVGNIFYYGNPPTVETSITGLGQIVKR